MLKHELGEGLWELQHLDTAPEWANGPVGPVGCPDADAFLFVEAGAKPRFLGGRPSLVPSRGDLLPSEEVLKELLA